MTGSSLVPVALGLLLISQLQRRCLVLLGREIEYRMVEETENATYLSHSTICFEGVRIHFSIHRGTAVMSAFKLLCIFISSSSEGSLRTMVSLLSSPYWYKAMVNRQQHCCMAFPVYLRAFCHHSFSALSALPALGFASGFLVTKLWDGSLERIAYARNIPQDSHQVNIHRKYDSLHHMRVFCGNQICSSFDGKLKYLHCGGLARSSNDLIARVRMGRQ